MDGAPSIMETPTHADAPEEFSPESDAARSEEIPTEQTTPSDTAAAGEPAPNRIVEAILLSSDTQMSAARIASIMGSGSSKDVRRHIDALNEEYRSRGSSFRIEEIAGGYQILTLPQFNTWLVKLLRVRQETKLTAAAMETLSIVAYKQPCTRAEVESVRGVAAGDMLNKLREMNLVKIVGRAEDLGRPILYGTTKRFLEVFGLPSLEDLPQVEALKLAPKGAGYSGDVQQPGSAAAEIADATAEAVEMAEYTDANSESSSRPLRMNDNAAANDDIE
ncbi:MAG: SMC-Scp complex subunit ScpB [Phycisphaerae bacterium]|nr:SMC-Scp complex subunit ScpB [Phycisphaerae bacterium]